MNNLLTELKELDSPTRSHRLLSKIEEAYLTTSYADSTIERTDAILLLKQLKKIINKL